MFFTKKTRTNEMMKYGHILIDILYLLAGQVSSFFKLTGCFIDQSLFKDTQLNSGSVACSTKKDEQTRSCRVSQPGLHWLPTFSTQV